ncbi:hypothetical protein [Nocardia sp. NPDC051832]|uniref:hypothetical protein n=1 Tax=Nocardia sp. NPDC051832 TaxID=3155673 RepID=UPI00343FE19E
MNRIRHRSLIQLGILVLALAMTPLVVSGQASAAGSIVLTNADSARSVDTKVGNDVEVRLNRYRENGITYTWHLPEAGDSSVLPRMSAGVTRTGDAVAVFRADIPVDSVITVRRTCHPDPNRDCPAVMLPWKAAVRVR